MNQLRSFAALTLLIPLGLGCAARTAPFDQMDKAQVTVLRLGQPPQAPAAQGPLPGGAQIPGVPGVPAEWQQMGQQILQGAGGVLPPGLIPPGILPQGGATPQQAPAPQFKGFTIVAQMPLTDESLKDEILDIFGHEGNFSGNRQNCFTPGMGIVMQSPGAQEVDLLISLGCNQAMGDGFRWPYPVNGFTTETRDRLGKLYEKLWGPVPPGA